MMSTQNVPDESSSEVDVSFGQHSQQGMFAKFARGRTQQMSKTRSAPDLRDSASDTIRASSRGSTPPNGVDSGDVSTSTSSMTRPATARVIQTKETQNSIATLEARLRRENEKLAGREERRGREKRDKRRRSVAENIDIQLKAKEEQKDDNNTAMVAMMLMPDSDSEDKEKKKKKHMSTAGDASERSTKPKKEKRKSLMADVAMRVSRKDRKEKEKKEKQEKKEKRKEEKLEEKQRKRRSTSISIRKKESDMTATTPVSSYSLNPAQAAKLLRDANINPSRPPPPASISLGSNTSAIAPSSVRFRDDVPTSAPEKIPVSARESKKPLPRNDEALVGDYMKKMAQHELQAYKLSHGDENVLKRAIRNKFLLHVAIEAGHDDVVRFLVENKKFKLNTPDAMGWTPLHCACDSGRIDIILFLLSKKRTNVQKVTNDGCTALHYLIRHFPDSFDPKYNELLEKYSDVMNRLVSIGCDISATDRNGETVLHYAAFRGNASAVRYLLSRKDWDIDINSTTNAGETPLHLACYSGSLDTVNALLEAGAATNVIGINGTPTDIAKRQNDKRLVMALLKCQQKREPSRYRISKADAQYLGYAYSSAGEDGDMDETTEAEFISDVDAEQDAPRFHRPDSMPSRELAERDEEEESSLYFGSNKSVALRLPKSPTAPAGEASRKAEHGMHKSSPVKLLLTRNEDTTSESNRASQRISISTDNRPLLSRDEWRQRRKTKSSSKRVSKSSERTKRRRSVVLLTQGDQLVHSTEPTNTQREGKGKERVDDDYDYDYEIEQPKQQAYAAQDIQSQWEDEQEPQDRDYVDEFDEHSSMKSSGGAELMLSRRQSNEPTPRHGEAIDPDDKSEHISRFTENKKQPHILSPGRLRRVISFDDQFKRKKDKLAKSTDAEPSGGGKDKLKLKSKKKKKGSKSHDESSRRRKKKSEKDSESGSHKKDRDSSKKSKKKKSENKKGMNEQEKIRNWLADLNLPLEYMDLLLKDGFDDMATIQLITEEDLADIGIAKTGHRKRIMRWVRQNPASPILSPRMATMPETGLYQPIDAADPQIQEAMMMAAHGPMTALPSHPSSFGFAPYSPYAFIHHRGGDQVGNLAYLHSPHSISVESPMERKNREARERKARRNSLTTPLPENAIHRSLGSPFMRSTLSSPSPTSSPPLRDGSAIRRKLKKSASGDDVPIHRVDQSSRLKLNLSALSSQDEEEADRERRIYTVSSATSPRKVTIAATPAVMLNRPKSPRQREPHQVYAKVNIQPTSGSPLSPRKHHITPIPIPATNHFMASSAMSPVTGSHSTSPASTSSSSTTSSISLSPILSPRLPPFTRKPLPRPPHKASDSAPSPRNQDAWY